ncbi:hypothetical protein RCL_jg16382.t1 [Rhizophagus clarus]|uniref:Uncharacterized protein n=1 Tax=Rhizophagus clarus TaxID=94130 RepID=A0A8H3M3P4_9GLOM|nr:hypothetical protein RCL_jg16382.t1 [Rhizophagus clarus]
MNFLVTNTKIKNMTNVIMDHFIDLADDDSKDAGDGDRRNGQALVESLESGSIDWKIMCWKHVIPFIR